MIAIMMPNYYIILYYIYIYTIAFVCWCGESRSPSGLEPRAESGGRGEIKEKAVQFLWNSIPSLRAPSLRGRVSIQKRLGSSPMTR